MRPLASTWSSSHVSTLPQRSRNRERILCPLLSRFCRRTREHPLPDAFVSDFKEVCETANRRLRIREQPLLAVEQMLCRVVGAIADERLGIDDKPWLSPRHQHVAGVEIGGEQHVVG